MCLVPRSILRIVAVLVCSVLVACASTTAGPAADASGPSSSIGWLHEGCIALADAKVRAGTGVVLVSLEEPQRLTLAHIQGPADDPHVCPALLEDRRVANLAEGLSYYRVMPATEGLAIGVLSDEAGLADIESVLDIDGDGRRDAFGHCATTEGVRFTVWAGQSGQGEPLWNGYYYLGYDVQADCPDVI